MSAPVVPVDAKRSDWPRLVANAINRLQSAPAGSGTVTTVSVTTANGVSGVVANPTTTPAITVTLGAITPSSVAASGTVTGSNLSGTNTGDQTITLTGNVTGSGTGSFVTTIANSAVTLAKIANASANSKLLGSGSSGSGAAYSEITLGSGLTMTGTTLSSSGSSGSPWSIVASNTISSPVANVDFTGLGGYTELLVIGIDLVTSVSGFRALRYSVNGGSSYYSTSGDYKDVSAAGVANANTVVSSHASAATAARDIRVRLENNIAGVPKTSTNQQGNHSRFDASTSVVDAIRVLTTAGNLTSGTIYILGRT